MPGVYVILGSNPNLLIGGLGGQTLSNEHLFKHSFGLISMALDMQDDATFRPMLNWQQLLYTSIQHCKATLL
jgi:hypothetical protein